MPSDQPSSISARTIEQLQELVQVNIRSEAGFREASEKVRDKQVAELFREIAAQRAAQSTELRNVVRAAGVETEMRSASKNAKFHRIILDQRAALNVGDPALILEEMERGEVFIQQIYEDVLGEVQGGPLRPHLIRQADDTKKTQDRIRDLRTACKLRA